MSLFTSPGMKPAPNGSGPLPSHDTPGPSRGIRGSGSRVRRSLWAFCDPIPDHLRGAKYGNSRGAARRLPMDSNIEQDSHKISLI
jgi:hypothetical protein